MPKHIHADLMLQYAQDATETDKPWERWEVSCYKEEWVTCELSPVWNHFHRYRRKPNTLKVKACELPKPLPSFDGFISKETPYYFVVLEDEMYVVGDTYENMNTDHNRLGRAFRTGKEAQQVADWWNKTFGVVK